MPIGKLVEKSAISLTSAPSLGWAHYSAYRTDGYLALTLQALPVHRASKFNPHIG